MQTSRRELLDDFLAFVGARGDAKARDRAERLLNRAVQTIWSQREWLAFLEPTPHVFASAIGVRSYALPDYFGRVQGKDRLIRDSAGSRLAPADAGELAVYDPQQGTAEESPGTPQRYLVAGSVGVHTQPAAAGEALEVVSSSAADVAVRVLVEGVNGDGQWTRRSETLVGPTPVAIGTWSRVQTFGKSYPEGVTPTTELTSSVGDVTLRTVAAATELQLLLPDESALDLPLLTLWPVPASVRAYAVPVYRRPRRLRHDADILPADWEPALFEELTIQWRVQAGELKLDANVPRPKLGDLFALDETNRPRTPRQPWTGG